MAFFPPYFANDERRYLSGRTAISKCCAAEPVISGGLDSAVFSESSSPSCCSLWDEKVIMGTFGGFHTQGPLRRILYGTGVVMRVACFVIEARKLMTDRIGDCVCCWIMAGFTIAIALLKGDFRLGRRYSGIFSLFL